MRRALIFMSALAAFAAMVLPAAAQVHVLAGTYHGHSTNGLDVVASVAHPHEGDSSVVMGSFRTKVKVSCRVGGSTMTYTVSHPEAVHINDGHAHFSKTAGTLHFSVGVNFTGHGTASGSVSAAGGNCHGSANFALERAIAH